MIVNAGFQKTGTMTCGEALSLLGYRYLKAPGSARSDHIQGRGVLHYLEGYEACGDFPFPFLLDEIVPDKVILTVRKSSKRWLQSLKKHLARNISNASRHYYFRDKGVRSDEELVRIYERHNEHVRQWCRLNRIPMLEVCWERGDGWKSLCEFLDKPIPDKEFPWLNKS